MILGKKEASNGRPRGAALRKSYASITFFLHHTFIVWLPYEEAKAMLLR
jgi:hypothetical protein